MRSSIADKFLLGTVDPSKIGIGSLSDVLAKGREFAIRENFVLQLVSARNVAQSEQRDANDETPYKRRTMLLVLTDGRARIRCLDAKDVVSLSSQIPPGTKMLLKGGMVRKGVVLLEAGCLEVGRSLCTGTLLKVMSRTGSWWTRGFVGGGVGVSTKIR